MSSIDVPPADIGLSHFFKQHMDIEAAVLRASKRKYRDSIRIILDNFEARPGTRGLQPYLQFVCFRFVPGDNQWLPSWK